MRLSGDSGHRMAADPATVGRHQEVGEVVETEQVAHSRSVERRPGYAVREHPLAERLVIERCLRAHTRQFECDHYSVSLDNTCATKLAVSSAEGKRSGWSANTCRSISRADLRPSQ